MFLGMLYPDYQRHHRSLKLMMTSQDHRIQMYVEQGIKNGRNFSIDKAKFNISSWKIVPILAQEMTKLISLWDVLSSVLDVSTDRSPRDLEGVKPEEVCIIKTYVYCVRKSRDHNRQVGVSLEL